MRPQITRIEPRCRCASGELCDSPGFPTLPLGIDRFGSFELQHNPQKDLPMAAAVPLYSSRFLDLVSGRSHGLGSTLARAGLTAASVPYSWVVQLRNRWYDHGWIAAHRVSVPVVSVGNLTVGGTGKTPCVEYLARYFRDHGLHVAILSRGYGVARGPNDEARLLAQNLPDVPHLQGSNRSQLANRAVDEFGAQILILDDGFQHRRLARNLDIVLVDATNPWGHGRLMPRGLLREAPASLRRAGAVILTRCDQVDPAVVESIVHRIRVESSDVPIVESTHQPQGWIQHEGYVQPLDALRGRNIAAICGVGNPDAFRRTLVQLDYDPLEVRVFPDHHNYTRGDVAQLMAWAQSLPANTAIATTQKDLVKLRSTTLGGCELFALRIGLNIAPSADAARMGKQLRSLIGD
jgi:tetraacyldisaccharide 4'-kinase